MNWAHVLYASSILAVIVISGFVAAYSRRHRNTAGGAAFMWVSVLVCLLALLEGLSIIAPTAEWALFWFDLRFLCLATVPLVWLVFVIQFTGQASWITSRRLAALFLIPLVTQVMIWTNAFHGLWVKHPVTFQQEGPFFIAQIVQRIPGPWIWVHFAYSYALVVAGLTILAVTSLRLDRRGRGQIVTVGLGTLIMAVVSVLPSFGFLRNCTVNPLVPGFAVGMLVIFWGTYRHRFLRSPLAFREEKPAPVILITLFVLLATGIVATGYFYYRNYEKNYRTEVEHMLSSIAELKASEITQWRNERLSDALLIQGNTTFAQLTRRVMDYPADVDAAKNMRLWLSQLKSVYLYRNVILMDASGRVRQSVVAEPPQICDEIQKLIPAIRQSGKINFLDFHREAPDRPISLSIVNPIMDNGRFLGAVAMMIDPNVYLYPMMQRWPTPSKTAETLLVRREGNEVVFLNELKFQKDAALNLRLPLSRDDLPAARAARGEERVMEGTDYRGEPVVAALRTIPDSSWFMVARMDREEIYAPIRTHLLLMIFMVCVFIFGAAAVIWIFWQRQRNIFFRRELDSAEALQVSEEKFRKAFMTSPDAILIIRWSDGRVVSANSGFPQITGYTREEAEGRTVKELSIWENLDDRARLIEKIRTDGLIRNVGARFRKKNGDVFYGLVSASLIDLNGERHLLSITRDITDRIKSEDALHKAHGRLRRFHDSNIIGIVIATADGGIVETNDYYLNVIGFSREEFEAGKIDWRAITPPEWLGADEKAIEEVRREGVCTPYEKQYIRHGGTRVDVFLAIAKLPGEEEQLAAFVIDITDRKRVEREVLRLNEELEERVAKRTAELSAKNEELERLNRVFVDRELRMRELKKRIAELEKKT